MPIFALPVGIILIWMQRKPNAKGSRIALTVFLVSGCLIWFAILGSSGSSSSSSVQIQQSSQEISQEADTPQDNATIAAISAKWQGSTKAETTIVKNNNLIVMAALDDGSTKWLSDSNYTIDAEQELVAARAPLLPCHWTTIQASPIRLSSTAPQNRRSHRKIKMS